MCHCIVSFVRQTDILQFCLLEVSHLLILVPLVKILRIITCTWFMY